MTLSGKDAEEHFAKLVKKRDEERAQRLAEAKAAGSTSGKEPFDLAKLETMCVTSREGRVAPVDERQARFEEMYYVEYPTLRTLAELAEKITERNRWW